MKDDLSNKIDAAIAKIRSEPERIIGLHDDLTMLINFLETGDTRFLGQICTVDVCAYVVSELLKPYINSEEFTDHESLKHMSKEYVYLLIFEGYLRLVDNHVAHHTMIKDLEAFMDYLEFNEIRYIHHIKSNNVSQFIYAVLFSSGVLSDLINTIKLVNSKTLAHEIWMESA